MGGIFFSIYHFFNTRKKTGILFFLSLTLCSTFLITRLQFEENILKTIPNLKNTETVNLLFSGNGPGNKVIFHLYLEDSSLINPDHLISICDQLVDSLQSQYSPLIGNIKYQISDESLQGFYNFFYENLPLYLEKNDYQILSEKITEKSISQTIENNYRLLSSPIGPGVKKMIVKDPLSFTPIALKKLQEFQFDENFNIYKNHILTTDKKHLIFLLDLKTQANETGNNTALIKGLLETVTKTQHNSGVRIDHFGSPIVAVSNASRIKTDISITVSLALVSIFILIILFFRKIDRTLLIIIPGAFGALFSLGALTLIFDSISLISLGIGSVLLGITVDYSLHFFTHFKDKKNIKVLLNDISTPLILSSLTTACAFYSLLFLKSEVLNELGVFAGNSVIFAALISLIVLPHFLVEKKDSEETKSNSLEKGISFLADLKPEKSKWAILLILMIVIICFFNWQDYQFEKDMMKINYMPRQLSENESRINDISNLSRKKFYLAVKDSTFQGALLKNKVIREKYQQLKNDSLILKAIYINDIILDSITQKEKYQEFQSFWEQNNKDSIVQLVKNTGKDIGFSEKAFFPFQALINKSYQPLSKQNILFIRKELFNDLIIEKDSQIIILTQIITSSENKNEAINAFKNLLNVEILDKGHITNMLVDYLNKDFSRLVNISLIFVFILLLVFYGRIELAIIAFIPIVFSWVCTLGIMGIFGLKFNIVNIIISTFIFGLGIDYSIFVLRGLIQNFATQNEQIISFKKSIILSAITTLLGMGVLIFAKHPALQSIALLAMVGISSVFIMTFTIQPWLFNLLIQNRKNKEKLPITLNTIFTSALPFFIFLIGCIVLNIVRLVFLIPIGNMNKKKNYFHRFIRFFCSFILKTSINVGLDTKQFDFAQLKKPSIIIANHASFIDILFVLSLSPKVVIMVNEWVYKSIFFGKVVQYADFVRASEGPEVQIEKIEQLVNNGYSIIIFPEGTRSETGKIKRFHKGAFFLAERLNLDILPAVIHGANYMLPKLDTFYVKDSVLTLKSLTKIKVSDLSWGTSYKERTKKISRFFKSEFEQLQKQIEVPGHYQDLIFKNYIYKGPILEWYVKVKFKMEKAYAVFHQHIPEKGKIIDLGCGYGIMSLGLSLASKDRQIYGIDYDERKIQIAKHLPTRIPNLSFQQGDVTTFFSEGCNAIILSDVLHYLTPDEQVKTLNNCLHSLAENGKLVIRDGDKSLVKRQKGTWLSEFFSTNIGFNKTRNQLNFISSEFLINFAKEKKMKIQEIDHSKLTSNKIFILIKNG